MATASGTRTFLQRATAFGLHPSWGKRQLPTGLEVTPLGLDTYRASAEHLDVLRTALDHVNVIDTASVYDDVIIRELLKGKPREEFVLCTKVGASKTKTPDCIEFKGTFHSLNPDFLSDQVPIQEAWEAIEDQVATAIARLRNLVPMCGVSGNFISCYHSVSGRPNTYEGLDMTRMPSFLSAVQMPLNLIEHGAVLGRERVVGRDDKDIVDAKKRNFFSFANRPINGLGGQMGLFAHDWSNVAQGRGDGEFFPLKESVPLGLTQSLLKKAIDRDEPLENVALRVVASLADCCLNGVRSEAHVDTMEAVLRQGLLPDAEGILLRCREAIVESGAKTKQYW
eukprot:GEMP01029948.1.p1 GENE.GEMP01029948.1~~GEMP01029948.1.p1  ORF type:complete len:339 (+),score=74.55 GEMP01029948.1:196-1212(+)